jgi:hypothetical protein
VLRAHGLLLLSGVVDVGEMDVFVEHGRGKSAEGRGDQVNPQKTGIHTTLLTLSRHINHLVNCVNETEGGVEASTRDGASSVDHSEEGESNSCGLKDAIFALLCAVVDLANNALAEEECAPELKKEDLAESVEVDATSLLIIGAEECRLSHTEMSVNDTEEATDAL